MGGWVGLTLIIRLSLSSNWTELDWTGTELGKIELSTNILHREYFPTPFKAIGMKNSH